MNLWEIYPSHTEYDMMEKVRSKLTPDLLRDKKYAEMDRGIYCGHCAVASEALFYLLGGKETGYHLYRAKDEQGISHWWVVNAQGVILDSTREQYTDYGLKPPYDKGKKACPNQGHGYVPTNRAKILMERVLSDTDNSRKS